MMPEKQMEWWTADEARKRFQRAWDYFYGDGLIPWGFSVTYVDDIKQLFEERDALVQFMYVVLLDPEWLNSKVYQALPEYLRQEIEDGT
jgi:hypothetical protein